MQFYTSDQGPRRLGARKIGLFAASVVVLCCLLGGSNSADGYPPTVNPDETGDISRAEQLYLSAKQAAHADELDSALTLFNRAGQLFAESGDMAGYVKSLQGCAGQLTSLMRLYEAKDTLEKCLKLALDLHGPESKEVAYINSSLGFYYFYASEYTTAIGHFEKSIDILTELYGADDPRLQKSYQNMGQILGTIHGQEEAALDFFRKALKTRSDTAKKDLAMAYSYISLSRQYRDLDELTKAERFARKSLAIVKENVGENHHYTAGCYRDLAAVFLVQDELDSAKYYLDKGFKIAIDRLGEDHVLAAFFHSTFGRLYRISGDFPASMQQFERGMRVLEASESPQHLLKGSITLGLGINYSQMQRLDEAQEYFQTALKIFTEHEGPESISVGNAFFNIGMLYQRRADHDSAMHFFRKAMTIFEEFYHSQHSKVGSLLSKGSASLSRQGLRSQALQRVEKSLEINKKLFGRYHGLVASSYRCLADLHRDAGNRRRALELYQQTLHTYDSTCSATDLRDCPKGDSWIDFTSILPLLIAKARTASAIARTSNRVQDAELAYHSYRSVADLFARLHLTFNSDEAKEFFLRRNVVELHEELIAAAWTLHQHKADPAIQRRIFAAIETSKSVLHLEALRDADAKAFADIPDSLVAHEAGLRERLAALQHTLVESERNAAAGEPSSEQTAATRDTVFWLQRERDELLARLERDYPAYFELKHRHRVAGVDDLQEVLQPQQTLLSYFCGENVLYVAALNRDSMAIVRVPAADSMRLHAAILRAELQGDADAGDAETVQRFAHSAYWMWRNIVDRPLAALGGAKPEQLIVVPDNELAYLPFEIFVRNAAVDSGATFQSLDYLLHDCSISYAYSATLFRDNERKLRTSRRTETPFVGFAPDFGSDTVLAYRSTNGDTLRSHYASLPWARREVEAIAGLLGGSAYSGKAATESRFKDVGSGSSVIHIASHGQVDNTFPLASHLVFSDAQDKNNDGNLYAYEIYNLKLDADLVVLSACNTGIGAHLPGEGLMGLSRAFSYAGVPAILMTLWRINDHSTYDLMQMFYNELHQGLTSVEALNQAKRRYLAAADNLRSHPRYWAAFALLGRSDKLQLPEQVAEPLASEEESSPFTMATGVVVTLALIGLTLIVLRLRSRRRSA